MSLEAIKYKRGHLEILDQLLLPLESRYINISNVRGAPAIAIVGCLSLAVELTEKKFTNIDELNDFIIEKLNYLVTARPTAVNMKNAAQSLIKQLKIARKSSDDVEAIKLEMIKHAELMLSKDVEDNVKLSDNGAKAILQRLNNQNEKVSVMTHCNTGSLATAGYGTALGIIRSLSKFDRLQHVYCTETRPYNQGARLTAYELVYENIPATLICDSMAGWLMQARKIDAVVTGADHVAANGDVANKIGTYALAVLANYHNVPFFVAVPSTTYHPETKSGQNVVIEERPHHEMTHLNGCQIAAAGINCWNPAFDITPASLITGIVTELGVFAPGDLCQALSDTNM